MTATLEHLPEHVEPVKTRKPLLKPLKLALVVVALAIAVGVMLFAFATPAVNSKAHDLPLGVAGPEQAVSQLTGKLEKAQPGAFDVHHYNSLGDVESATKHREVIGGISITNTGVQITTASAAGTPYAQVLKGIATQLQATGMKVNVQDVAPLTSDDPMGSALAIVGLPLAFGGMGTAVLLVNVFKHHPWYRFAGAVSFAVVGGLVAGALLRFWLGTVDGHYWAVSGAFALGIGAAALTILGLESLLGYAGLGLGAVLMLFIANPLSGLATGPQWLPAPWGAIGQGLPIGAAGSLIRSVAFFDGGAWPSVLVLLCWVAAGVLLLGVSSWVKHRRRHGRHVVARAIMD